MRTAFLVASVLMVGAAWGQSGSKANEEPQWNNAWTMARSGWNWLTQNNGQNAKETIRKAPGQYKAAKASAEKYVALAKHWADPKSTAQQRALLAELWRVRSNLDVIALTDPAFIKKITGYDVSRFSKLRSEYQQLTDRMQKRYSQAVKGH